MSVVTDHRDFQSSGQAKKLNRLSKSRFIAGVQCLKRLYLQTNNPELASAVDPEQQGHFDQGHEVGRLAQAVFPGGVLVTFDGFAIDDALAQTAALIEDSSSVPAIFEATFCFDSILVRVDILERLSGNCWKLIEVKSSTSCKDHYLYDIAIQHQVLLGCGLGVRSSCLMHLNRDYIYNGQRHEPTKLFTLVDLTSEISRLDKEIPRLVYAQREALNREEPPQVPPGPQCLAPYECEFFAHCTPPLPDNHVIRLPHLSSMKAKMLADQGISVIGDIPSEFPLSELQQRVCESVRSEQPWFADSLQEDLSELQYPLCFMDFETLYPAIPRYSGMRPYSHVPFQWSVHRQQSPEAEVVHFEFLAEDDMDPRHRFLEALFRAVGQNGHVVVYNAGFEMQRLEELAEWVPERRIQVDDIKARIWDLYPFVKRHIYHPDFRGSFSLKAVLPALIPDLTYDGLEVGNGEEAGRAWEMMMRSDLSAIRKAQIKEALLAYCRQDTWALVSLLKFLKRQNKKT